VLGQAGATLPEGVLGGQQRKELAQLPARRPQELPIGADPQDGLGHAQRDDLRVGDPSPGVPRPLGQEIVSGAEHRSEQQVEVGEHRGPQGSTAQLSTADFDPRSITHATPPGVASII
jgi:hypothetical protein